MTDNLIAPAEADERSVEAVEERHAALARALHVLTETLVAAAGAGDPSLARQAQHRLVEWCEWELLPHIGAEEQAIYPAARYTAEGRFLAKALLGEHEDILALARSIVATAEPAHAAGAALALRTLLDLHLASEDQLLPLLASDPGVSPSETRGHEPSDPGPGWTRPG